LETEGVKEEAIVLRRDHFIEKESVGEEAESPEIQVVPEPWEYAGTIDFV